MVFKNGCGQNKALNRLTDTFSTSVLIIHTFYFFFILFRFVKVKGCCISIQGINRVRVRQKLR